MDAKERIFMREVKNFPARLPVPKVNSERWNIKNILPKVGLTALVAGVIFGIGLGFVYNRFAKTPNF